MKNLRLLTFTALALLLSISSFAQCKHTITVHNYSVECNGNGTSTVSMMVTVLFGNGNNSVTISYNTGFGEVNAVVLEDDNGDIINGTYEFNVPSCDNYTVTMTAWTNPSGSGMSCDDPAPIVLGISLPVTYGDINIKNENGKVLLNWNTFSEVNNDKFIVQRSKDGDAFSVIGEIKGAGESSEEIWYEFIDKNPLKGNSYYRLLQVDLDGTESYSEIQSVRVDEKRKFSIYPNPATDYIYLSSEASDSYQIYDSNGNLVIEAIISENNDEIKIDLTQLKSGIYVLKSVLSNTSERFIKN